jgi:hypothetical protein
MKLIAFLDGTSANGSGGMILDVQVKDKYDIEAIMEFIEVIKLNTGGMIHTVTVVNPSKTKVAEPYIHPPLANQANADGSYNMKGKRWLELILKVDVSGEEE